MEKRILIVDDDDHLRDMLSLYIDYEDGFEVAGTAADAAEATALALRLRPDAIVLDHHMPGVDGIAAIPALRDAVPDARIVMFSANDDGKAFAAAMASGAAGYVTKNGQQGLDDVLRLLRAS